MKSTYKPRTHDPSFYGLIGVSRRDITPPPGIHVCNWGASTTFTATGVHLPLTLTCVVIYESGKSISRQPLAILSADLGWWKNADDEKALRYSLLEKLGLTEDRLMFCLSHTHAGPSLHSDDCDKLGGELIEPYLRFIETNALSAFYEASHNRTPAILSVRYGKCSMAANRDQEDEKNGEIFVGFNPSTIADDTLLVGRISKPSGELLGTIVNYACHPTVLAWDNSLISPDYVGAMRSLVEAKTEVPCMFLQGASGELALPEQYVGDTAIADNYGTQLGHSVLATLLGMYAPCTKLVFDRVVESGASLAVWSKKKHKPPTTLQARQIPIEAKLKGLPSLEEIDRRLGDCTDVAMTERLWRLRGLRKAVGSQKTTVIQSWVWRLGEICFVGQPNEAYSWFQLQIRQQSAPTPVAVMNIVNGYVGYLPPTHCYDKQLYAVWQTPFSEGTLEGLTEAIVNAINDIMNQPPLV